MDLLKVNRRIKFGTYLGLSLGLHGCGWGFHWQYCGPMIVRNIFASRVSSIQNHYESLGVKETCSQDDIRIAFLKKCVELHPDKNLQNPVAHKQFVAVNEAYSILNKCNSRLDYDMKLRRETYFNSLRTNADGRKVIFPDESLWEYRNRTYNYKKGGSYYGNSKRLNKVEVARRLVLFMIVATILEFSFIKMWRTRVKKAIEEKNRKVNETYLAVKEVAFKNGNELQLQLLLRKKYEPNEYSRCENWKQKND